MTVRGGPGRGIDGGIPPANPPHRVTLPVNIHDWVDISFLHWPMDPDAITTLLPPQLKVLTHGGTGWVGVTPFTMRVRLPGMPQRLSSSFPETNVRTYVVGPGGRQGLWFLHMEVTAAWFVAALRTLGLPYVQREMSIEGHRESVSYRSRPPAGSPGGHDVTVEVGREVVPAHGDDFDRFLTARWGAFHRRGALLYTPVEHPAWRLRRAAASAWAVDGLFRAAGLPAPATEPVVHHSPGVTVRVGRPLLAG